MTIYQQEKAERRGWRLAALVSSLSLLVLVLALSGCSSLYERARSRYATSVVDTTFTTVRQVVPRDSVVLRLVTDTTTIYRTIQQGRARIIYQRDPKTTFIKADCDSVIVEKRVPVIVEKQVWGVDPKYKTHMEYWRAATVGLLFVLIGLGLFYAFTYKFQITRRTNGAESK